MRALRRAITVAAAVSACLPAGAVATTGGARVPRLAAPVLSALRCLGNGCDGIVTHVPAGGRLKLSGRGLAKGMTVVFAGKPATTAVLRRTTKGFVVTVPLTVHYGRVYVLAAPGRRSRSVGPIRILRGVIAQAPTTAPTPAVAPGTPTNTAFDGQGQWIWELPKSSGGNVAAIIAQAQKASVSTVFVKSSDGSANFWAQFTPELIQSFHNAGIKVCAWQYVYGSKPAGEAALGARAVQMGADCLVIDAEAEYEGKYASAQTYIQDLRAAVGTSYPIGLAGFPYVDYHESFPYSVFLGDGGAQYNAPQMYWKAIGTSVDQVYAHTFTQNRIYERRLEPLGQTYQDPAPADLARFRQLAGAYGASGYSWWDWQETSARGWAALSDPVQPFTSAAPAEGWPVLQKGDKGDQVVWLQEHLAAYDPSTPTTGTFDATTRTVVQDFQTSNGLTADGVAGPATWQAALELTPVPVDWTSDATSRSSARAARSVRSRGGARRQPAPALIPDRGREIPAVGRGRS